MFDAAHVPARPRDLSVGAVINELARQALRRPALGWRSRHGLLAQQTPPSGLLLWVFPLGLVSQSLCRWLEAPWERRSALEALQADATSCSAAAAIPPPAWRG